MKQCRLFWRDAGASKAYNRFWMLDTTSRADVISVGNAFSLLSNAALTRVELRTELALAPATPAPASSNAAGVVLLVETLPPAQQITIFIPAAVYDAAIDYNDRLSSVLPSLVTENGTPIFRVVSALPGTNG